MKTILGGCFALALSAMSAHAAPMNFVSNGDFSNGLTGWVPAGSGTTPGTGIKAINGTSPYGDALPSYNGSTTAAFFDDDNANETLSQSLVLAANSKYNISFGLLQTGSGASNPNTFTLTDTVSGLSQTFSSSSVPVNAWTTQSAFFTTGSDSQYLLSFNFTSGATPAKDLALTGISVSAVPLPASAPMFGAALLALAGFGYGMNRWVAPKGKNATA